MALKLLLWLLPWPWGACQGHVPEALALAVHVATRPLLWP